MVKQPLSPLAGADADPQQAVQASSPRRGLAAALLLLAVLAVWATVRVAVALPSVPYNVRELFPSEYRTGRMGLFSVMVVWLVVGPAWAGWMLGGRRRIGWLLLAPFCLLISAVALGLVRVSVTYESILDVVGAPVWPGSDLWEVTVRWCALVSLGVVPWATAALLYGAARRGGIGRFIRQGTAGLLVSIAAMGVAWHWVVVWNATDNIDELVVDGLQGPFSLSALVFLLALEAQVVQHLWSRKSLKRILAGLCLVAVGVGPGWLLFRSGLVGDLHKYDLVYSGPQFLLGPDRRSLLSPDQLFLRWTVLNVAVVLLGVWAMGVVILVAGGGKRRRCVSAGTKDDRI